MIPIRDLNPSARFPFLTFLIIATNTVVFAENYTEGEAFHEALLKLGYIPSEGFSLEKALTSMFMHGSWGHLIANMWVLWVFGDNVEDTLGKIGYGGLYLLSGLAALFMHVLLYPASAVPVVGASGAISGVMGAYMVLFPRARIWTYLPPFYFTSLSARFFALFWFFIQLVQGILDKMAGWVGGDASGIAFWAHIGGFLAGWLLTRFLRGRFSVSPYS